MKIIASAKSDIGKVREHNEDSFLCDEDLYIFAVADGMGGHSFGEIASTLALETIRSKLTSFNPSTELLQSSIQKANLEVFNKSKNNPELKGMGTTITVCALTDNSSILIGHVGDSRAYILRENEFVQITQDHSVVAALIESGTITEEQADLHPQRSVITRALGVDQNVQIDLSEVSLETKDRILICSDGLTSMVTEDQILSNLSIGDAKTSAQNLINLANSEGGKDNITVIVIDIVDTNYVKEEVQIQEIEEIEEKPKTKIIEKNIKQKNTGVVKRISFLFIILISILGVFSWIIISVNNDFNNSYYLTKNNKNEIVIYRGIEKSPAFWLKPKVYKNTKIDFASITQTNQLQIENHISFNSKQKLETFLSRIK